ncbi:MAG: glycoside hydrolase family 13 protein [Clostridia bacterium]|nr:glycoside hydrolase family 13 protein [Clostridia bacterium]
MAYYNPFSEKYKSPFGAVCCNTSVHFSIDASELTEATLCTDTLGNFVMHKNKDCFETTITFLSAGLTYYWFYVTDLNGNKFDIKRGEDGIGIRAEKNEDAFQLTVYEETPSLPDWYEKGIVYQIFPDRFNVGGNVIKAKQNAVYREWGEQPKYLRNHYGGIDKWDFYGGNLKGVEEKLPYLKELGITAIYLNPIFESSSNHRYSTADFKKIDNVLGTLEDFKSLVKKADKYGIKLILDGVFNHVGADSLYFNRYGNYGDDGAYRNANSKYRNWFKFENYPDKYKCWWGVSDLPDLEKENEEVQKYLIDGNESVIKYWTSLGIGGWRLDVADELSDNFLSKLYKQVKAINKDAIVMGEVWEDASNKVAYNTLKKYFTHRELDCVMNYPFRDNLLAFFRHDIDAFKLKNTFLSLMENYPKKAFYGNFNLLGTHDTTRILTEAESILPEKPVSLLIQLVALQFVFPGVPCIYYGDEVGVTGGKDPDNRKPYPWGNENKQIFDIYKKYTSLRSALDCLKSGETEFIALNENVFGVRRFNKEQSYTLLINRASENILDIAPHGIKEVLK